MKRLLTAYSVWIVVATGLAFALAALYRNTHELTWAEVARRVFARGEVPTTDATDATVSDNGNR